MFPLTCTVETIATGEVHRCERPAYHSGEHISGALAWRRDHGRNCDGLCAFTECGGAA